MNNPDHAVEAATSMTERPPFRHTTTGDSRNAGRDAAIAGGGALSAPSSRRKNPSSSEDPYEDTPLLAREETASSGGLESAGDAPSSAPEWPGVAAFAGLPWWRRPSVLWLLPSLLVHTMAFGGILVPKLTLILNLICRDYFADRALRDPNFTWTPIVLDGSSDNTQCDEAVIQKLVSEFTLAMQLISGLCSMLVAPKLGSLSDRYGRTRIIAFTGLGVLLNEIITIVAATYPDIVNINWILFGSFLDGLSGTFITAMAITNAYAADCTPPERRAVVFGWIHGTLFTGIAIGPFLASAVMAYTKSALSFFYVALGVHAFFLPYILFVVPESLTEKRQLAARATAKAAAATAAEDYEYRDWYSWSTLLSFLMAPKELLKPLSILWPQGAGSTPALRRNLSLLAAIDFVLFGVAMGAMTVVVYYLRYMFHWDQVASSNFVGTVSTVRVTAVLVILPIITRLVRGKPDPNRPARNSGSDSLDIWLIRIAIVLEVIGFVGYAMAKDGSMFIAGGCVAALGGFGTPTMQSSLTKHVPPAVVGQLLGAIGLLHGLARVVAPLVFNMIYAKTVEMFPQTVFVCLACTFGVAAVMSLFLRSHVYLEVSEDGQVPGGHQDEDMQDEEIVR